MLAVAVGAVPLLLAAASLAAALVLGLPYGTQLVYPLFALLVGVAGLLSRRSARASGFLSVAGSTLAACGTSGSWPTSGAVISPSSVARARTSAS